MASSHEPRALALALLLGCASGRPEAEPSGAKPAPAAAAPAATASAPAAAPLSGAAAGPEAADSLVAVSARELVATSGEIVPDGPTRFSISSPTLRAELGHEPRSAAELRFSYRGPTQADAALASGELRRQIGLKLRAQDSCNVLYVMWRIEPGSGLVVSVKSNPGQSRHSECGDRGYSVLAASHASPAPLVQPGQEHVLGASIVGRQLQVTLDGVPSWVGELPSAAFEFDGPVGLRSDNGQFSVELRAAQLAQR